MNIEDMIEILAIDLIGVVPDDESIVVSTNRGEPAVLEENSTAGKAYRNIVKRIMGEDIPLLDLNQEEGLFDKIRKFFKR